MPREENREMFEQCLKRICHEFGLESGRAIMRVFIEELGGFRITVPTIKDLEREETYRRIRAKFNGANINELAEQYGITPRHTRRIVNEG